MASPSTDLNRKPRVIVEYQNATTATSVTLTDAGTAYPLVDDATLATQDEIGVDFTASTGVYEFLFDGPFLVEVDALMAATQAAGAIQRMNIERSSDGSTWTKEKFDLRIQDAATNTQKLSIQYLIRHATGKTDVSPGSKMRITFESDTAADTAEIYTYRCMVSRDEGIRGTMV